MTSALPVGLRAVFTFLDEALSAEVREAFRTMEVHRDDLNYQYWECTGLGSDSTGFARDACYLVKHTFQLHSGVGPLGDLLEEHRLYHESYAAPALIWAYSLHKRGLNPMVALTADYAFRMESVLSWMTETQERKAISYRVFCESHRGGRPDDRWARCRTSGRIASIILRGDRLVCVRILCYMTFRGPNLKWVEEKRRFDALGGIPGYLAGKFDWPPIFLDQDEEDAEQGKDGFTA